MEYYTQLSSKKKATLVFGILALSSLALTACKDGTLASLTNDVQHTEQKNQQSNPQAGTENNAINGQGGEAINKPSKPVVQDLPIHIQALGVLLHPILPVVSEGKKGYKVISSVAGKEGMYLTTGHFRQLSAYHIEANANNLIFEKNKKPQPESTKTQPITKIASQKNKLFTHNNFIIEDVFYPHVIVKKSLVCFTHDVYQKHCKEIENFKAEKTAEQASETASKQVINETLVEKKLFNTFLYKVQETQLTQAQLEKVKGNLHQQQALYMSDGMGKNVKKLHPDNEFVVDTKWMPQLQRYYFATRTDSNNNHVLELVDKQHNYMIDFSNVDATKQPQPERL